jgi:Fur family transcriptional regulator, peroxide stress response regulator
MPIDESEVNRRLEHFRVKCKESELKLTHQRLEIFREVAAAQNHPDAETIFRGIQPRMPTVSLDTVYRTLWMLNDMGLISTLGPRRESVRFDANPLQHHHYVCVRCGLAKDFESDALNALQIPDSVMRFGSVEMTRVEVRGLCKECADKQAEEGKGRRNR